MKPSRRKKKSESVKSSTETQGDQEEEEIDIDLEDPEVGKAAVKIQSSFRGHQARKDVENLKAKADSTKILSEDVASNQKTDIDLDDSEVEMAAVKIQSGFRGYQARKEVEIMKVDKDGDIGPKMDSTKTSAVGSTTSQSSCSDFEDEEIDIDLGDPEVGKAAVKIQSSFRGHQARKEVEAKKIDIEEKMGTKGEGDPKLQDDLLRGHQIEKEVEAKKDSNDEMNEKKEVKQELTQSKKNVVQEEEEEDIDLEDPEVGEAAIKIQSSFRGHQARKEVESLKEGNKLIGGSMNKEGKNLPFDNTGSKRN